MVNLIKIISLFFIIPIFSQIIVSSIISNKLLWIAVPIYLLLFYYVCKDNNIKAKFKICFFMMIIFQILFGRLLMVEYSSWDVFAVTKNARALATGEWFNREYFARYPNNLSIMLFFTAIFKFTNRLFGSTSNYFLVLLNIAAIDIAIIFAVKTLKLFYNEKIAYKTGVVITWFLPLYIYVPICYTDTFSMPILMGILYCFVYVLIEWDKFAQYKRLAIFFAIGSIILLGFKLKGSLIISLVAILIVAFIKYDYRNFIKISASMLIGFVATSVIWSAYIDSTNLISEEDYEKHQFPVTHWIMMGLDGAGSFSSEDVKFTASFDTYEERKNATTEQIIIKINELGPKGVIVQGYKKATKYGWNYGTCFAERYLGDVGDKPLNENFLHEFILSKGSFNRIYRTVSQGLWVVLLFFVILAYILCFKDDCAEKLFLRLLLLGCMIFFMIWETHPRYILHFTLVLIMIAVPEMEKAMQKILKAKDRQ